MNKISVIIPVYNVEKYLPQCLESVINQTYHNLEIILVDDGSTDSSPQICNDYATKDNRIKLIHKENGGSSDARNEGLKLISSNFVAFVDSDDILSPHLYQILMDILLKTDSDIAECSFSEFEKDHKLDVLKIINSGKFEIFDTEGALTQIMKGSLSIVVWNKIYKTKVLKDICFPKGKFIDDVYWTYKVFGNAIKVVKVPEPLYYYRKRNSSIMGGPYSIQRLDILQALEEMMLYFHEFFPKLEKPATKVYCFVSMSHYCQLTVHHEIDANKVFRKKIFSQMKKYNRLSILKNWHWKDITWFQLFIWSPKYYIKLRDGMESRVEKRSK